MTIEFYKSRVQAKKYEKDLRRYFPRAKVVKVAVVSAKRLSNAGGRKIGGRGRFKRGETGWVAYWKQMRKEAGIKRVR